MEFISSLFLLSAIHGIFLTLILITSIRKKSHENIFLALLLIIVSGYLFKEYLILEGQFSAIPHSMAAFVPLFYLLGPLYYFYVQFTIKEKTKVNGWDVIHLVPAIICFLVILPFYILSAEVKLSLYSAPNPDYCKIPPDRIIYYGLIILSGFFYCKRSLFFIERKKKSYSGRNHKKQLASLRWLVYYTRVFQGFLTFAVIAILIMVFTNSFKYYMMLSAVLASSILIHFISYWAIKESKIIKGADFNMKASSMGRDQSHELKAKILEILEKEKIYLNGDLSAREFCNRLSINSRYFSELINQEFGYSFTYLINSYRIREAKKMITDPQYAHLSFMGIAMEVGFNTKNTFTRAFKRHTGMTPTQYKSKQ